MWLALLTLLPAANAADGWIDINAPLRTGAVAQSDAAVVIGNEDYVDIPDVPYASADAEAFRAFLLYTRGVPQERIHMLTDASPAQMREAVKAASAEVEVGGRLWVYYAGHGVAHPETRERLLLGVAARLDPNPAVFEEGTVSLEALKAAAATGRGEVLFISDACYSGTGRGGEALADGRFTLPPDYTSEAAVIEWTATQSGEVASPLDGAGHGAFTYFVVGALRGWADGEISGQRDGLVDVSEAAAYVERALETQGVRNQQPTLLPADIDIILSAADEGAPDLRALDQDASAQAAPAQRGRRVGYWVLDGALLVGGAALLGVGSWMEQSVEQTLQGGEPLDDEDASQARVNGLYLGGYAALGAGAVLGSGLALSRTTGDKLTLGLGWSGRW